MRTRLELDLARLADGIFALRATYMLIHGRGKGMARLIEIKGLGNAAEDAKKALRELRPALAGLHESASMLAAEALDVKEQVEEVRADLRFEAQTLGNSGSSAEPSEKPAQPQTAQEVAAPAKPFQP